VLFSELEAAGWEAYDTNPRSGAASHLFEKSTLEPGGYAGWELTANDRNVVVTFTNLSKEVLPLRESHITFVGVIDDLYNAQLVLPRNIMMGSTDEDVLVAYGNPSATPFISNNRLPMFYDLGYFNLHITVNIETNQIIMLGLRYLSEDNAMSDSP